MPTLPLPVSCLSFALTHVCAFCPRAGPKKQNIQSRCPGLSVVDLCGTKINPEAFVRSDGEGEGDVIQGGAPLPWHTY